jgi:hypothetical protein
MIGFPTFRLEFHLAHLILREDSCDPKAGTSKPTSNDLSFLKPGNSSGSSSTYKIRQAHISVVLCGWGNTRWTGYAFANTGLDAQPALDHDEDEPNMDYFAADRDDDYIKDADRPIWDAREYWLQIVAIRCQLILKEWVYLVRTIQECTQQWVILVSYTADTANYNQERRGSIEEQQRRHTACRHRHTEDARHYTAIYAAIAQVD